MWMVMSRTSYLYHRALVYIAITFPLDPIVIAATERISSVHRLKKNVGVNVRSLIRDLLLLRINNLFKCVSYT